ncbi:hypothetical protein [Salmonella phage vB-SalM-PM10]|uniref:Uncharacterized protein n=2 Tax=Kuttervirus PM10 TaxID=2169809 RepID=A0A1B0Z138_9CAUD|nr:hypothetical protein BI092_gp028 [Salmonella phage vB-SalM-PM10]ANO57788.2 hypothetical protein [Salmonella phage vB-SalM-PM10]QIG60493.1 hypothetical protein chennai_128 [Salmonella phage Chennai]UNI71271.1 hypothetical protein [Salmonella phage vB_SenA_SM5]
MKPTKQEALVITESGFPEGSPKSNLELSRLALYELRISLGQADWKVLRNIEDADIKMCRGSFLMTYHQYEKLWSVKIIGRDSLEGRGISASEAYIHLRQKVEKIAALLPQM